MRHHDYTVIVSILVWALCGGLFAVGCGSGGDGPDGDQDGDTVETAEEAPTDKAVTLAVMGAVSAVYDRPGRTCNLSVPASVEDTTIVAKGKYDLNAWVYGPAPYTLNVWIRASYLDGSAEDGATVRFDKAEIKLTAPGTWPTAAIAGASISLADESPLVIGRDRIISIEPFSEAMLNDLLPAFSATTVDPLKWSGFSMELKLSAYAPNNSQLYTSWVFPIDLCQDCAVGLEGALQLPDLSGICCTSNVDETDAIRINNLRKIFTSNPDNLCHLYQDRDFLYCSWLERCYWETLDCDAPKIVCQ